MVVRSVVQNVIKPVGITAVNPFVVFKASPLNIVKSGPCQFWFDGQDEDVFSLNVNKVIQWYDKGLLAAHVSNAFDLKRPIWYPATGKVTFDAAAETYLQSAAFDVPLAQPNTIFVLYKITGLLGAGQGVFDSFTSLNHLIDFWGDNFRMYSSTAFLLWGATNANNNIHTCEFNTLNSNYWVNGILGGSPFNTGIKSLDGITLGARGTLTNNADVEIMEVFGYNCLLTNAEHSRCFDYLNNKWALGYINPW